MVNAWVQLFPLLTENPLFFYPNNGSSRYFQVKKKAVKIISFVSCSLPETVSSGWTFVGTDIVYFRFYRRHFPIILFIKMSAKLKALLDPNDPDFDEGPVR